MFQRRNSGDIERKMENNKKLKVLHVLKSSIYSGAENVVITIMKSLAAEFDFVYVATEGVVRQTLEQEQVPFVLLDNFNRKQLQRVFNQQKPDIIHAHDFSATVLCASLSGEYRLISHLHYDPPWVRKWNLKTLVYSLCYFKIDTLLTVSLNSFKNMRFSNLYAEKCKTVGNPIDGDRIRKMARESIVGLKNETCDLIFVGRLVEQKNPQRFVRLVARLRDSGWSDIKAWMLGDGELKQECQDLITELHLQKHIEMKGFQKNPYPFMKQSKILCITSRWEGFGLVAIEANMLGIPVVSTANAGCCEILGEKAPEICETDEIFEKQILNVCQSKLIYQEWKQRSLERGKQNDNIENYMRNMACIYRNEVTD